MKLHPEISNDFYFKTLQNLTIQYRNIIFWDNRNDIYEILNKVELAIVDYSSIYYDLVSAGVKNSFVIFLIMMMNNTSWLMIINLILLEKYVIALKS
ncbi:hypothetical protein [Escherichia coli]|uniref:hypothetical protein n=1 Tax=Escherichia coli TaxID=562 RepID=UPI003890D1D7